MSRIIKDIALVLAFLLPPSSVGNMILALYPIILSCVIKRKFSYNIFALFLSIYLLIVWGINFLFFLDPLSIKSFTRLICFGFTFILFPYVDGRRFFNFTLCFILGFILFSQLCFVFNISSLVAFYNKFWPYQGEVLGYKTDFLLKSANNIGAVVNRRYGGIYHNPNQCVRYVSLLFCVYLVENRSKTKEIFIFTGVVFISTLVSGSRTGLIVFIVINVVFYWKFIKKYSYVLIFVLPGALYYIYSIISQLGFRTVDISSGVGSSFSQKFIWFFQFIGKISNPLRLLFGHSSEETIMFYYGKIMLDSEWGNLIYCYGIVGSIFYILFLYDKLYRSKETLLVVILLWCITSTVLFSFRMCSIYFLVLSTFYYRKQYQK